jgi:NAD(P)-dependent dehydrogenase (short-subunit alcohol dehydrogenase family)
LRDLNGKVAVVTGAASGIGRGLVTNLAREGCSLALADVDETGLRETVNLLDSKTVQAKFYGVDVADKARVYRFADEVLADFGRVDIVINNAGVQLKETLEDVTYDDLDWLLGINLYGVIYGTKAFLPHLKKQPSAVLHKQICRKRIHADISSRTQEHVGKGVVRLSRRGENQHRTQ